MTDIFTAMETSAVLYSPAQFQSFLHIFHGFSYPFQNIQLLGIVPSAGYKIYVFKYCFHEIQ